MSNSHELLSLAIKQVAPAAGFESYSATLAKLAPNAAPLDTLTQGISRARKWLGITPLGTAGPTLDTVAGPVATASWSAADASRVALTLVALTTPETQSAEFLSQVFAQCTDTEITALLRGLALYADDARHKQTATLLGRTNSFDVFAALASNNPYPAAFYSEHEFNQLVLKALFVGMNIETIFGLRQRTNPTLSRMCEDYYDERVAAERSVPPDIWLALRPYASPRGLTLCSAALQGTDPAHRHYASIATHANLPEQT